MAFKKKQTMRSKSKKQPHWKELALLLSKKRQLNVVLRREVIPPAVAVASTSENSSSRLNSKNCHEEDNLASDEEDIIRIKQEIVTTEPSSGILPESNDQGSSSASCSGKHRSEYNFGVQPSCSKDSDETYNVSMNDFKSLLVAATQRSDIRLSIENTYFNLSNIDDQISTEYKDSEPDDLQSQRIEQNNILMIAKKNKKKQANQKRKTLRSTKNDQNSDTSVKQNSNHDSTKINENKVQGNNLQSKSILESSTNETTMKKKQHVPKKKISRGRLRNKYKIQDQILENEFDLNRKKCAIIFDTKTSERPAKRKIDEIEEQGQDEDQRKQNQTEGKNQQDSFVPNCKITKRLRRKNARMQVSSAVNVNDANSNGIADNSKKADEMPVNKTGELERHTKEGSEECAINTEKNKTKREAKSISYEIRSLRRRIIGVSKSQKQIQAALQSSNDRFDLFGKTIAACLRELPRYESQCLEIKLMDVLLEEKRNMTLASQPMYSNGHNGQ